MRTFTVFIAAVLASLVVPESLALVFAWKWSFPDPAGLLRTILVIGGYISALTAGMWLSTRSDNQSQGSLWFVGMLVGCGMGVITGAISSLIYDHGLDGLYLIVYLVFGTVCGLGACGTLHFLAPSLRPKF